MKFNEYTNNLLKTLDKFTEKEDDKACVDDVCKL